MDISNHKLMLNIPHGRSIKVNSLCAIYAFVLTVAACAIGSTGSSVLMLIITAMFAPLILMPELLLGPILFFSIFDDYLLAGSGASASRFVTIFFIASAVITVIQKGTIKKSSLYFVVLILLGVLLSFYSNLGYTSLPISYAFNVILAIAMINSSSASPKSIAKQFHIYVILALAFVYFLFAKNGFDSLAEGSRMSIDEDTNSNQIAMGLAIVMTLLVSDILLFKQHTLLNIFLIGANIIALFLTGSRTALIAAIVAAFFLYIFYAHDSRNKRKAFILLIFSIALLVTIYNALQKAFPILMERFTVENVEESRGTGRVDVWENYFTYFFQKHWFIGMGFDPRNFYYSLVSINVEAHGAHNILVDILSRTGTVGLVLYIVCFVKFFCITLKNLRTNKFMLLPLAIVLTTLINGIGENVLAARFLWFGIGLGYLFLNTANIENNKLPGGNYGA